MQEIFIYYLRILLRALRKQLLRFLDLIFLFIVNQKVTVRFMTP